jgi:hypothetical protein
VYSGKVASFYYGGLGQEAVGLAAVFDNAGGQAKYAEILMLLW